MRAKENSLPVKFREQFAWMSRWSLVGVDLWAAKGSVWVEVFRLVRVPVDIG